MRPCIVILTREAYATAIDRMHTAEKRRLLARWDFGAKKYGVLELDSRNWIKEARQETDDRTAYMIFEACRKDLL